MARPPNKVIVNLPALERTALLGAILWHDYFDPFVDYLCRWRFAALLLVYFGHFLLLTFLFDGVGTLN